jgi:hypothetical protein
MRLFLLFAFSLFGAFLIFTDTSPGLLSIYSDRFNKQWRVPIHNTWNDISEFFIEGIPRANFSFGSVRSLGDFQSTSYVQSLYLPIIASGVIDAFLLLLLGGFFILRNCFGFFGGSEPPRKRYSDVQISATRGILTVLICFFEACVIYGFFVNESMDSVIESLLKSFELSDEELGQTLDDVINRLPDSLEGNEAEYERDEAVGDFRRTKRYAQAQSLQTRDALEKYRKLRYALVLVTLLYATASCSVGLVAITLTKSELLVAMLIGDVVTGCLLLTSVCLHLSSDQAVREFCGPWERYIRSDRVPPMKYQVFLSCGQNPLIDLLFDYSIIKFLEEPETQNESLFSSLDRLVGCRWTKEQWREDSFLLCDFSVDTLDMLFLSQGLAFIVVVVSVIAGIASMKQFQWASAAGVQTQFMDRLTVRIERPIMAKRVRGEW